MALRQNAGESIATYVRTAEKLSKRVPSELDSVLALCLIKGMADEMKKADISYIVNATPNMTFHQVVEVIKAKYRVIGEPDPFGNASIQKQHEKASWSAYSAPPSGSTMVPVVAAVGRMDNIPTYNVERRMGTRPADEGRVNESYGDKGLAAALKGCGISLEQFKSLMDWYLHNTKTVHSSQSKVESDLPEARQDFRTPALPAPRVVNPALGDRQMGITSVFPPRNSNYGPTAGNSAPPNISCFTCGRRGQYASTCPYPPLPPADQEHLREAARIGRLQRAGLPAFRTAAAGASTGPETSSPKLETLQIDEARQRDQLNSGIGNGLPATPRITEIDPGMNTSEGSRAARISSACTILSRMPPVMAIIQDVMAGKRSRAQADPDDEYVDDGAGPSVTKVLRTRPPVESSGSEAAAIGDESPLLDRIVVRSSTRAGNTRSETGDEDFIRRDSRRERGRARECTAINADNTPPSPMVEITDDNTDNEDRMTPELTDDREYSRNKISDEDLQLPDWLREARRSPAVTKPAKPAPINLMKGLNPYNIEDAMVSIKPEITFPQLLDVSPRLHRELALLLRSSQPRTRKKRTPPVQIDKVSGPVKVTEAAPDAEVECMYITVWCKGIEIPDVLVDGGAMIDLIAKDVVDMLGLEKHPVHNLGMQLADDSLVALENYVWLDVNVEGVVARVRAYVMPVTVTYKILLSRRWLKRIKGVEHHSTNTLIIQGVDGIQRSTKGRPAPPAELEVVGMKDAIRRFNMQPTVHDDDGSADDAIDALLHELDDWELNGDAGNGLHRQ